MRKGFTLIEYLVTISIIGILSAAVVLGAAQFMPSIHLNGVTKEMIGNLRRAQEETVSSQLKYTLRFNQAPNPTSYQLIKTDAGGNESTELEISIPSDLTVTLEEAITNHEIAFSPDGGPSTSGNITITGGGQSKVINISPAGVIKL